MTINPPPAPDWVMGDDGHWKPPPFEAGFSRAAAPPPPAPPGHPGVGPAAGPGPWAGPPPPPPSKGGGTVLGIVAGVVAVVVLVPVVLILAVTLLGREAEPSFQSVGTVVDGGSGGFVPVEPDPGSTAPPTVAPDLAAWCPTGAEIADALGESSPPDPAPQPTTPLDLNGVVVDADLCFYGSTVEVGRIPTSDPDAVLADLATSSGRFVATEGGLAVPSVRLVLADGAGQSVRLVLRHGDQLLTVAMNGPDDGRIDDLAAPLLARPPG